jgi:hypothetical protein
MDNYQQLTEESKEEQKSKRANAFNPNFSRST